MVDRTLEIDRVSKRYGDVVAVADRSFEVRAGELFGREGMDHVQVAISPPTVRAVEEFGRVLELLDREVPPEPA